MNKCLNAKTPKYLNDLVENIDREVPDLSWVDGFINKIKPYVYVRGIDRLLILIPNQAYGLNETGVMVLDYLLSGHTVSELLQKVGDDASRRREIHYFFCDLRAVVSGCLRDHEQRMAVDYHEFKGGINQYPVLSEVAVTYRCNLDCEFCYVGKHDEVEMDAGDVKRILFKIYNEAKIPSVSFTGGEPMLREDIVSLVSYATQIGLWTNIITNGTLLDRTRVEALARAGLSSAQVSIEGPSALIHDKITKKRGGFEAALRGIRLLSEAGIPVHTNTTISRSNIEHAMDIVALAKRLGLSRLSMNLVIPCGSAGARKDIWVLYSEIGEHILEVKRYAEDQGIKFLWYSPVPLCMFNPIAHGLGNKACAAITGLLSIDPAGNIIPCSSWRKPVGSLLDKGFREIWDSRELEYYKDAAYAPEECRSCSHFETCKGACPLYWRALGRGEMNG